jgi:general secretion pathway protein G
VKLSLDNLRHCDEFASGDGVADILQIARQATSGFANHPTRRRNRSRSIAVCGNATGFTLIEVLLVIVIIGILVSGLAVSLSGRSQEAMITRARADISGHLRLALDLFEQDLGRYPTNEEGLAALVQDTGDPRWKGSYLTSGLVPDPWNNPYQYQIDPMNPRRYLLRSAGPDGRMGTDDDITN